MISSVRLGGVGRLLSRADRAAALDQYFFGDGRRAARRVLLLPPDHTRLYSDAGFLTAHLYRRFRDARTETTILPALGTHAPMDREKQILLFGPDIPEDAFRVHDFRRGVMDAGTVPGAFVKEISGGRVDYDIPAQVNRLLAEGGFDRIISIGQVVPHEVAGMANHAKNIFVGAGGADFIHRSHFLGAVCGIESILGCADSPVRRLFDYALENFGDRLCAPVDFVLTVVGRRAADGSEDAAAEDDVHRPGSGLAVRGIFAGPGREGFTAAAELSQAVNFDKVARPLAKAAAYLPPEEFSSCWLGNKAIYRLRLAMADDGELVILAPAVKEFGEDPDIDRLIRRHGYKGTPATLAAVKSDPELAANLSAAATLIHGSTEGRFRVTYATDPALLSRADVEAVGFGWRDAREALSTYNPSRMRDGWNRVGGEDVFYVSNPALGLWSR